MGVEAVERPILQAPGNDALASALVVHQQVERKVLGEEGNAVLQRLLVEGMQQRMAGPVCGRAGAAGRQLAKVLHVPAERPLIDPPVLGPAEGQPEMLELENSGRCFSAHVLDRVLVAEPVRSLDGVIHVPLPGILR